MRRRHRKSDCPIHFALEIFGDAWTLLIIRDLMFKGRVTYTDFLNAEEGIATNVLADRLVRLEEDGVIQKEAGSGRGTGSRYWLTAKGIDLLPVLLEIIGWSAKHDPQTAADPKFVRRLRSNPAGMKEQIRKQLVKHGAELDDHKKRPTPGEIMTVLENSIRISASPERVWSVLASLESLDQYDPGIKKSEIVSRSKGGPGSARRCDLTPGGWFKEQIADWRPNEAISFELVECTLPVRRLMHSYTLTPDGSGTLVRQRMEYDLKFGPVGKLMDALMVRRKWDAGIKDFFVGLKYYVETGQRPPGKA